MTLEYATSYALIDGLRVGLSGLFYQQVTDDRFEGFPPAAAAYLSDAESAHSRVFSVGPAALYRYKNVCITFRPQFETAVENKTEGFSLRCKVIYSF